MPDVQCHASRRGRRHGNGPSLPGVKSTVA